MRVLIAPDCFGDSLTAVEAAQAIAPAGQVILDRLTFRSAGVRAAFAIADYAASVQLAVDDASHQPTGLARQTASALDLTAT